MSSLIVSSVNQNKYSRNKSIKKGGNSLVVEKPRSINVLVGVKFKDIPEEKDVKVGGVPEKNSEPSPGKKIYNDDSVNNNDSQSDSEDEELLFTGGALNDTYDDEVNQYFDF